MNIDLQSIVLACDWLILITRTSTVQERFAKQYRKATVIFPSLKTIQMIKTPEIVKRHTQTFMIFVIISILKKSNPAFVSLQTFKLKKIKIKIIIIKKKHGLNGIL